MSHSSIAKDTLFIRRTKIRSGWIHKPVVIQVLTAIGALIIGVVVYLVDRTGQANFVPDWMHVSGNVTPIFGLIGYQLPTFAHTFAFILLTAAVLWSWTSLAAPICAVWFTIECLFELGQIDMVASKISAVVPDWFDGVPVLEATSRYFLAGTFDLLDVVSIAFGSVAAYLLIRVVRKREISNATANE